MRFKFLDWYTQALGATFGILACIYAYLNGYMFVYGNIEGYFDFLGFSGVISSYLLLPLCLLSLFISLIRSYTIKKEILNMSFESINIFISILTVVVGFMGAKIYFTIPAAFILFHILEPYLHNYRNWRKLREITPYIKEFKKHSKNIYEKRYETFKNKEGKDDRLVNTLMKSVSDAYVNRAIDVLKEETVKGCGEECIRILEKIFIEKNN